MRSRRGTGARGLGTPSPRALARARVAPRVRSCESVSECCGWCRRAGAHGTGHSSWSAHSLGTSPPFTSRVRRAAGAAKGPRAPRGYSRIVVRPASASAHPTRAKPSNLSIYLSPHSAPGGGGLFAPLAPPHTRRFLPVRMRPLGLRTAAKKVCAYKFTTTKFACYMWEGYTTARDQS